MGLTIAEVFVLLVFTLLLLFLLWRWDFARIQEALGNTVDPASPQFDQQLENLKSFRDFANNSDGGPTEKELAPSPEFETLHVWITELHPEHQHALAHQIESLDIAELVPLMTSEWAPLITEWRDLLAEPHIRELVGKLEELPPQQRARLWNVVQAGKLDEAVASSVEADQLRRLVPSDADRRIARSVASLSPEQKRKLEDLVQSKGLTKIIEEGIKTAEAAATVRESQPWISRLEQAISDNSEISRRLNDWKESRDEIVDGLTDRLGGMVSEFGGSILPHGRIALPNERLGFAQGTAEIQAEFTTDLGNICRGFLETLHDSRNSIQEIRIEGHASSEWSGATASQAYRNNLDLSQRRAHVVLDFCLDEISDSEIRQWARSHIVAIGYSSSRPVYNSGNSEDLGASRRVEFGYLMNDNEALEEMRSVDSLGRNSIGRIQPPVGVIYTGSGN